MWNNTCEACLSRVIRLFYSSRTQCVYTQQAGAACFCSTDLLLHQSMGDIEWSRIRYIVVCWLYTYGKEQVVACSARWTAIRSQEGLKEAREAHWLKWSFVNEYVRSGIIKREMNRLNYYYYFIRTQAWYNKPKINIKMKKAILIIPVVSIIKMGSERETPNTQKWPF